MLFRSEIFRGKKDKHEFLKNQILFSSKKVIRNWGITANFGYQFVLFWFVLFFTHCLENWRLNSGRKKIQTTAEGKFMSKYYWSVKISFLWRVILCDLS